MGAEKCWYFHFLTEQVKENTGVSPWLSDKVGFRGANGTEATYFILLRARAATPGGAVHMLVQVNGTMRVVGASLSKNPARPFFALTLRSCLTWFCTCKHLLLKIIEKGEVSLSFSFQRNWFPEQTISCDSNLLFWKVKSLRRKHRNKDSPFH